MMSCRFWVAVGVECQKHCHPFVQNCYASRREIATHFYTKARNNRIEGRAARGCHEWWCCVTICKISALCQMRENGYLASYSGVLSKPWKRGRRQHISTINEHSRYLLFLSCRSFHWQPSYLRSKKIGKTKLENYFWKECAWVHSKVGNPSGYWSDQASHECRFNANDSSRA